jgi:hypothetical protein
VVDMPPVKAGMISATFVGATYKNGASNYLGPVQTSTCALPTDNGPGIFDPLRWTGEPYLAEREQRMGQELKDAGYNVPSTMLPAPGVDHGRF